MSTNREMLLQFIVELHHAERQKSALLNFNQTRIRQLSVALTESIADYENQTDDNKLQRIEIEKLKIRSAAINEQLIRINYRKSQAMETIERLN